MKKCIHILALDSKEWIGGLYYKRNILFSLLQNEWLKNNFNFMVTTFDENKKLFEEFQNDVKIVTVKKQNRYLTIILSILDIINNVKYVFPASSSRYKKIIGIKAIGWIPDFQHKQYPYFFNEEEIRQRDLQFAKMSHKDNLLVLSSKAASNDCEKYYGKKEKVYIVPFVSYIEPEIKEITEDVINGCLKRYDLISGKYVCICNQFWKHKNHIIILKAIKLLAKSAKINDLKFVFTGLPKDYRNPEYYNELMELIKDKEIEKYIKILGFIDRKEQLALIMKSKYIIQPSLFEGWGTFVEDSKVLGKLMLLSDIPVHREQMNDNCVLFDPYNEDDLVQKIMYMNQISHNDSLENGIKNMYKSAEIYSGYFSEMIKEAEGR